MFMCLHIHVYACNCRLEASVRCLNIVLGQGLSLNMVKTKQQHKYCHILTSFFSKPQDNRVHIGPKMEIRVVTLGLDGAGKTTILFKLKQDEFMQPIPTIGKFEY